MLKAIKIAAGLIAAVIIGSAMARGLPHHAAAPAPPPQSGGSGGSVWWSSIFPVIGFAGLGWLALALYHRRKLRDMHMREAKLDGFVNVRRSDLADLWRCPDCHALILIADIDDHQEESACAEYQRWRESADAAEGDTEPPAFMAHQIDADQHVTATVPPEHSVITGGYDSLEG